MNGVKATKFLKITVFLIVIVFDKLKCKQKIRYEAQT